MARRILHYSLLPIRSKSISQKILVSIFIISSFVTLAVTIIQISFDYFQEIDLLKKSLKLIEKSYVKSIIYSHWELNDFQTQTQLDGIVSNPGIEYATILHNNKVIAKSGIIPKNFIYNSVDLIHYGPKQSKTMLGTLVIYASIDHVYSKISEKIIVIFLTQLLKTLLVSLIIYYTIQHLVTRHLTYITDSIKKIDLNSQESTLVLNREKASLKEDEDELDILVHSINQMHDKIYHSYLQLDEINKGLEKEVATRTKIVLEQAKKLEYTSRMSSLGEMAAGIAHEINNPITIIGNSSNLLRRAMGCKNCLDDKTLSYLDKIDNTAVRITKIIKGLLTLSRDASSEDFTVLNISEVLDDVLLLCQETFKCKNIEIQLNINDSILSSKIFGNKTQLSQVFFNLLINSYDAIEKLNVRWIKIDATQENSKLKLRFIDSGKSIPEDLVDKIMQPFFTTKEIGKGTGLGLSLSEAIIRKHNGEIYIDKDCDNTCFVVVLPLMSIQEIKDIT